MARSSVTETNRFLVLDAIRSAGATTRPELAADLDLSPASVSRIVRGLLADALVIEEPGPSDGVGRNRDVLRFNQRAGAVIAIDLGGTKCHGALADLAGEVLAEDLRPTFADGAPASTLLASIDALRQAAARENLPVRAVCVGIPAVVNPDTGLVDAGPNVHWHGFDLTGLLASELAEPFTIENDANLAGLGEAWRGGGVDINSFVALSLGTGIGAAIVVDGRVLRGQHNAAGEVGYVITRPSQLNGVPRAGLEDLISGPALAARARELIAATPDLTTLDPIAVTPAHLFTAAAAGDQVAATLITELIESVAIAITAVTAVVDPARVILGGSIGRALAPYLAEIETLVGHVTYRAPEVVVSSLGPNATVIGAIASALALYRDAHAPTLPDIRTDIRTDFRADLRIDPGTGSSRKGFNVPEHAASP
jgi:predicted NBD/HSP70 family sugar kinase